MGRMAGRAPVAISHESGEKPPNACRAGRRTTKTHASAAQSAAFLRCGEITAITSESAGIGRRSLTFWRFRPANGAVSGDDRRFRPPTGLTPHPAGNAGFANADGAIFNGCETNINTDPNNCGSPGNTLNFPNATAECINGVGAIASCNAGFANADGVTSDGCEVNLNTDPLNCGSIGNMCGSLPHATGECVNGQPSSAAAITA